MTQGGYQGDQQYGSPQGGGYGGQPGGSYGAPQGNYGGPQQGGYNQAPPYNPGGYQGGQHGGYGPPPSYDARSRNSIGAVGLGLTLLGLIAVVVGMFALNWASEGADSTFTDIADAIDRAPDGQVVDYAQMYFSWLAWVLLIGSGVVAILANLPTGAASALRPLGLLIGVGAAVATLFAIKLTADRDLTENIKETGPGFWTVIAGFVVVGIGAAIGPKRA